MDMKKLIVKIIIITIVMITAVSILLEAVQGRKKPDRESAIVHMLENSIMNLYLPGVQATRDSDQKNAKENKLWTEAVLFHFPVFLYSMQEQDEESEQITESDYAALLLLEGSDEERKNIEEGGLEYEEDSMHLDEGTQNALLEENGMYTENQAEQEAPEEDKESESQSQGFMPVQERVYTYQWDELQDHESLIKAFYAVDSTTVASKELIDLDKLLDKDMSIRGSADKPQILIYHTHSQEAFADSVPGDESTGIVGAGEYLAQILREQYGYNVIHYTESFDKENRDYAYSNSLPVIEKLLEENPSIEVVIDLHRDAVREGKKLLLEMQGRPTAQFMFFNGMSRTKKGEIAYLENPYLQDNLAFSFQMQAVCNEYYPGIARRIYLKAYRYNMHVCPKTLLIELGAQTNTREEIWNACEPLAHALHLVLSGQEPEKQ